MAQLSAQVGLCRIRVTFRSGTVGAGTLTRSNTIASASVGAGRVAVGFRSSAVGACGLTRSNTIRSASPGACGVSSYAYDRYFVGNGTNWSSTSSWATTTGGTPGASVPTAFANVHLDANSPGNLAIDSGASCLTLDCTGFTHTLTQPGTTLTITGNLLKLAPGMTYTPSGPFAFSQFTASTVAITTAGKSLYGPTLGPASCANLATYQLQDDASFSIARITTLQSGSFDTGGYALSAAGLSTQAYVAAIQLHNSAITMNGTWDTSAGGTIAANTATVTSGTNIPILLMAPGQGAIGTINLTAASNGAALTNVTAGALTITGNGSLPGHMFSGTTTVTGTLTLNATVSPTAPTLVLSSTFGTQATISAGALVCANRVDFQDINATGAAAWNPTSAGGTFGDCLGNTGITFTLAAGTPNGTGGVYRYAKAPGNFSATATWAVSSGGAAGASVPLPQDTVIMDATAGAGTYTANVTRLCKDIICTGFTRTLQIGGTIYGNLTLSAGMSTGMSGAITFSGRGAQTITSAGQPLSANSVYVNCPGGSYTLQDAAVFGVLFQNQCLGTFNDGGHTVSAIAYQNSTAGYANALIMSGTWTVTSIGNVWLLANTSMTLTATGSTIIIADTGSTNKTFSAGLKTYGNLQVTGGGTGTVTIQNGGTFNSITIGAPKSVVFPPGLPATITNSFVATGSSGNIITITSNTPGSPFTLSVPSGVVSCDWLSLKDSAATGGASFYAGAHSTNVSGNTGWSFTAAPIGPTVISRTWAVTQNQATRRQGTVTGAPRKLTQAQATGRAATVRRTQRVTQAAAVSLRVSVGRKIALAQSAAAALQGVVVHHRRVAVTQTAAVSVRATAQRPIRLTQGAAVQLDATATRRMRVGVTQAAVVSRRVSVPRTVALTQATAIERQTVTSRGVQLTQAQGVALGTGLVRTIALAQGQAVNVVGGHVGKVLWATLVSSVTTPGVLLGGAEPAGTLDSAAAGIGVLTSSEET